MHRRDRLMVSSALAALVLGVNAGAASAQTAAQSPPQTAGPTEQAIGRAQQTSQNVGAASVSTVSALIVTAESHAQTLQRIPIAVSDFTDERRNLVGIETESDIVNFTPSMSLNGQFLSLRGVGRYTDELGTDPGVAIFVDGIYTNSPDYLNQPDFFADRIEILRGPQGTENGRNAIGGAVNIVEKRPTPDFHAEGRLGYTNFEYLYGAAAVSGPITNTLGFRLAYYYAHQPPGDGYVKNLASSIYPGSGDSRLTELQLEWKPNNNLDLWFKVQNYSSDNAASYGVNPSEYPGFVSFNTPVSLVPDVGALLPPTSNPEIANRRVIDVNDVGKTNLTADWTFTTQATWRAPWGKIEYIGGYSQYAYHSNYDFDATPFTEQSALASGNPGLVAIAPSVNQTVVGPQYHKWYQNEIKVSSNDDQRLKWTFGGFQYWEKYYAPYYEEEPDNATMANPVCAGFFAVGCAGSPPVAPNPQRAFYNQIASLKSQSQAVYGQVDYDITDTLRLTGGLRYNWDQKDGATSFRYVFDTAGLFFAPGIPALDVTPALHAGTKNASWRDWSGKIGAEWRPDPSTMIYASIAKGYKSGGMVLGNFVPIPTAKQETLYAYELGVKKTFRSKLLFDADVYYYDYHNLQQFLSILNQGIISSVLIDAQKARSYGFELESVWSPTPDFHLTVNYSYLNARFVTFTNTFSPGSPIFDPSQNSGTCCAGVPHANLNGNVIPQSPTNKVTINPTYTAHMPLGDLTFSATYAFVDKQYYGVFTEPAFLAPSYYDLDLRLLFQPKGGHYTFILFARNVTDQRQIVNYTTASYLFGPANLSPSPATVFPSSGQVTYFVNPPRVFGGEIQVRF